MINNVLYLVGGTCTGKTTLARKLEGRGFRWVRSITTRPRRPGERDEYKDWPSPVMFHAMEQAGELDYIRDYTTHDDLWRYAFLRKDLAFDPGERYVMIGDPVSAQRALGEFENVLVLMANRETVCKRLKARGCSAEFIRQRLRKDDADFDSLMRFVASRMAKPFWTGDHPMMLSGPPFGAMTCFNDFDTDLARIIDYLEKRMPRP